MGILALGAFFTFTAWIAGSNPIALMLAITFACTAQGWWRGGGEIVGLLAGTLLALVITPSVGPMLDGPIAGALGTAGVQTRVFSLVITFVLITLVVTIAASFGAKRFMKGREWLIRWNRAIGGGIGLVEGSLLGFAVLWVPLALEPVAKARLAAEDDGNVAARGIIDFARQVRDSSVGGLAERTSPLQGSEFLGMAEDFAIVSRNQVAMAYFVDQPVMKRIMDLPSVKSSLERLKQDPELKAMFSQSSAVSSQTLLTLMRSPLLMDVLDHSGVVHDLQPMVEEIGAALKAAKEVALGKKPG